MSTLTLEPNASPEIPVGFEGKLTQSEQALWREYDARFELAQAYTADANVIRDGTSTKFRRVEWPEGVTTEMVAANNARLSELVPRISAMEKQRIAQGRYQVEEMPAKREAMHGSQALQAMQMQGGPVAVQGNMDYPTAAGRLIYSEPMLRNGVASVSGVPVKIGKDITDELFPLARGGLRNLMAASGERQLVQGAGELTTTTWPGQRPTLDYVRAPGFDSVHCQLVNRIPESTMYFSVPILARGNEESQRLPPLLGWIDESGDPSIKPGTSRWFTAALVLETGPPGSLASAMSDIKASLPPRTGAPAVPHFQALRFPLKQAAHARLATVDFTLIVAAIDTRAVSPQSPLRRPQALYAHALSSLIDQGSRVAALSGRSLIAAVEDSSVLDLDLLRAPATTTRPKGSAANRGFGAFPPGNAAIRAQPKNSDLRLGAADGLANAFFSALERGSAGRHRATALADMHLSKLWAGRRARASTAMAGSCCRQCLRIGQRRNIGGWRRCSRAGDKKTPPFKGALLVCGRDIASAAAPPPGGFFRPKAVPHGGRLTAAGNYGRLHRWLSSVVAKQYPRLRMINEKRPFLQGCRSAGSRARDQGIQIGTPRDLSSPSETPYGSSTSPERPPVLRRRRISVICMPRSTAFAMS